MATCAYCGSSLEQPKCSKCGKKARDGETIQKALREALGGRYQFVSILGAGGFAEVYKATDTMLDRDVAIKRVKLDAFGDVAQAEDMRRRAVREAQVAARLNHPNIVTIHDIIDRPNMNFIVMEFIDGDTLSGYIRKRKRLSLDEAIAIISPTAEAIDYAHSETVIHRDIKPANIMIEPSGRVKVMDFGIAKSEASQDLTAAGSILGTPNYMSPEQARGIQNVHARSDIYSLGCIVYECLSGEKAFQGSGAVEVIMQIVSSYTPVLDTIALDLHEDANKIIKRALAKDPVHRFDTATELVEALRDMPRVAPREPKGPAVKGSAPDAPDALDAPDADIVMPVVTRRDPDTASSFDLELQGTLEEKSAPELIRLIYSGRKTGILHVSHENVSKRIYFRKGTIVFANSDAEEDRLGKRLVREKLIDPSLLDLACGVMKDTGQRLGRTLVELGSFDEARLDELVEEQVRNIIYSLFRRKDGYFGFELLSEPVEEDISLNLSTADTILEGVRRIDSIDIIREGIIHTDRVLIHTENPLLLYQKMSLTPSEGYVLSRVDGQATVEEIASISPLGEKETLRCVFALISSGVLELSEKAVPTTRLSRPRTDVFAKPDSQTIDTKADLEKEQTDTKKEEKEQEIIDDIATKHASLGSVSYYGLLEIEQTASPDEVKKSYYKMVKKYHPDRHHSLRLKKMHGLLEEIFVKIQRAYECLSKPEERKHYDSLTPASTRQSAPQDESSPPEEEPTPPPTPAVTQTTEEKQSDRTTYTTPDPHVLGEVQFRAAKSYYAEMSYFDAIKCARDAIRYVPDKGAYHKLLAKALAKNPKWNKKAEEHFKKAIELDEFDIESHLGLAELYDENGMSARAVNIYKTVLEYDPDNRVAYEKVMGRPSDTGDAYGKLRHLVKLLGRDKKSEKKEPRTLASLES